MVLSRRLAITENSAAKDIHMRKPGKEQIMIGHFEVK